MRLTGVQILGPEGFEEGDMALVDGRIAHNGEGAAVDLTGLGCFRG